jgi:hypothetical protein
MHRPHQTHAHLRPRGEDHGFTGPEARLFQGALRGRDVEDFLEYAPVDSRTIIEGVIYIFIYIY